MELLIISPNFRFMIIHWLKCICCSIKIWRSLLTIIICIEYALLYHIMLYRVCPTWSHNVVSSTPSLSGIRTHNFSGDRYWLHRYERGIRCLIYLEQWITCATGPVFSSAPQIILASCPADEIDISRPGNVIVYMPEDLHL